MYCIIATLSGHHKNLRLLRQLFAYSPRLRCRIFFRSLFASFSVYSGASVCMSEFSLEKEDEDGRLQSLLEALWIRIDDIQRQTVSRHISFFNVVAQVLGSKFDAIFGPALVSPQSIAVSVCYGLASDALLYILIIYQRRFVGFADSLVATFCLYLLLGSILRLYRSRISRLIWFSLFLFVLWWVTIGPDVSTSYSLYSEGDRK